MFKYPHHPWAWLAITRSGLPSTLHQARNSKRTHLYGGYNLRPIHPRHINASFLIVSLSMMGLYPSWKKRSSMRHLPKSRRREASKSYLLQMLVRISQMDMSTVISVVKNATFWVSSRLTRANNICIQYLTIATIQCNTIKQRQTKRKGLVERLCTNKYCNGCLKRRYNEDREGVVSFFKWATPPQKHLCIL